MGCQAVTRSWPGCCWDRARASVTRLQATLAVRVEKARPPVDGGKLRRRVGRRPQRDFYSRRDGAERPGGAERVGAGCGVFGMGRAGSRVNG